MQRITDEVRAVWPKAYVDEWERLMTPVIPERNDSVPHVSFSMRQVFPEGTEVVIDEEAREVTAQSGLFTDGNVSRNFLVSMNLAKGKIFTVISSDIYHMLDGSALVLKLYEKGTRINYVLAASQFKVLRVNAAYSDEASVLGKPAWDRRKLPHKGLQIVKKLLYDDYFVLNGVELRPLTSVGLDTEIVLFRDIVCLVDDKHYAPYLLDMVLRSVEVARLTPDEVIFRVTFPKARVRIFTWGGKKFVKSSEANPGVPMRMGPKEKAFVETFLLPWMKVQT